MKKMEKEEDLVKVEGNNNAETEREPEGSVEKEEEFAPSFAGVWSKPQAGSSRSCNCSTQRSVRLMNESEIGEKVEWKKWIYLPLWIDIGSGSTNASSL